MIMVCIMEEACGVSSTTVEALSVSGLSRLGAKTVARFWEVILFSPEKEVTTLRNLHRYTRRVKFWGGRNPRIF